MALPELGEGAAYEKGYLVTWTAPKPEIKTKEENVDDSKKEESES